MANILNISGYKFTPLTNLPSLQVQLKSLCQQTELKGTILLAAEGINIVLAGTPANIATFLLTIKNDKCFGDIDFKQSYSEIIPFKKLLIKIKKEIITFFVPHINPTKNTAPKLSPQQFKQWLEQNKDMVVLDTRNECEIAMGKFATAVDLGLKNFRTFPQAAKKIPAALKQKPIVTYCTGGIRCEKAAAYLMELGFQEVYQLDGGILKYFVECGGDYYQGKCFVFDDRIAIDEKLK